MMKDVEKILLVLIIHLMMLSCGTSMFGKETRMSANLLSH